MCLIGFITSKIFDYYEHKSYSNKKEKNPSVIKQWYKDFKAKHCTIINWK